ncbi:ABC transporter substrate-binding protein [Granulosicoccaceae sp. 1_MG-2023]|nr:ABC transporter substrate-binding protein [Granulosicoccaceae sp. 1_MG-2023]
MSMKKSVMTAGVFLVTALGASLATADDALLEEGVLQVAMEATYPPFESYDGDKIVGFDPDMSALLAEKMSVDVELNDIKFTTLILGLGGGKFDAVISGMYITPERVEIADAIPYAKTGAAIMVLKGSEIRPKNELELCGVKVGLQQGTSWVKALSELSTSYCVAEGKAPISIQEFPTAPEVTQALMSRNVEAQVEIAGAAALFVERTKGRVEITSPELVYPQTLGIYVKKGNTALKERFEKALAELKADGSYYELLAEYDLTPVED